MYFLFIFLSFSFIPRHIKAGDIGRLKKRWISHENASKFVLETLILRDF